jgi:hypothetical protein
MLGSKSKRSRWSELEEWQSTKGSDLVPCDTDKFHGGSSREYFHVADITTARGPFDPSRLHNRVASRDILVLAFWDLLDVLRTWGATADASNFPNIELNPCDIHQTLLPNWPPEARKFCAEHGIDDKVNEAVRLIKDCFPSVATISLSLIEDPEGEEQKLAINIVSKSDTNSAFEAYDKFLDQWIELADWETRRRVCLSYNVAK